MSEFRIDEDRQARLGFPEVIYGESKSIELLEAILQSRMEKGENALATRVQPDKGASLLERFSGSDYDPVSKSFLLQPIPVGETKARVGIVSAGSSDDAVVNEAYRSLAFLGVSSKRVCDVGVAGIHRLLDRLDELKRFEALIVVAGFEGALPSVVGGLLPQPIVAVPCSVGYGVASGGKVALEAMLSSCANGISVMNIDNGYGAAVAIYRFLRAIDAASEVRK
jgi:NCAIR mutase (PurE)-related protein